MYLPEHVNLYFRVWSAQQCAACQTTFQYLRRFVMKRPDLDWNATQATVERDILHHAAITSEPCPCPHCGWVQPDMVGGRKAMKHATSTFVCFLLILVTILAAAVAPVPRSTACFVAAIISLALLHYHLYIAFLDPNQDLEKNLETAAKRVSDDELQLLEKGGEAVPPKLPSQKGGYLMATLIQLGSILLFVAPVWLGWFMWACMPFGLILVIAAGSWYGNLAFDQKKTAHPLQVVDLKTVAAMDEDAPAEFAKM